jgi:glycosyltransferase involved in cell wall biosynthesis
MEVIMRKKYPKIPVRIIENWSEVDLIKDSHTKKDNELSNNGLTFLFAGNFGRVQGLDVLLSGIKLVKSDNFDVKFLGDGVMKDFIKSFIETNKMNNVVLLDRQPREQQNLFLNNCQVGIVSLTKGMYGMGVPSKFYNLLAAGKAIFYIGDENTELQFVLNEYKNGWFAKAGDVSQIREVFEEIIACDQNEIIAKGIRSRKLAEEVYAKEIILSKYLSSIIE